MDCVGILIYLVNEYHTHVSIYQESDRMYGLGIRVQIFKLDFNTEALGILSKRIVLVTNHEN